MLFIPASRTLADSDQVVGQNSTQPDVTEDYKQIGVTVNGVELVADVAATGEQRGKGLAVKDHLEENEAMLFVFSKANDYQFWMKDMKFPIDIIWLDTDRRVVHVEHSLQPCDPDYCPQYNPGAKAQYVLETVAGFAERYGVTDDTVVEFDTEQLEELMT